MKIKKGTVLDVCDSRKGKYTGIALEDFDTEEEWYKIAVHQEKTLYGIGMGNHWNNGQEIPARKGITSVTIKKIVEDGYSWNCLTCGCSWSTKSGAESCGHYNTEWEN